MSNIEITGGEAIARMLLGLTVIVVNNAASGYVKALQHLVYGEGNYQSSDLSETNYANVAQAMGCQGIRVVTPDDLAPALGRRPINPAPLVWQILSVRIA